MSPGSHWRGQVGFFEFALDTTVNLDKLATEGTHTIAYISAKSKFNLGDALGEPHKKPSKDLMNGSFQYRFDVTSGRILSMRANWAMAPDPPTQGNSIAQDFHETDSTMTFKMDLVGSSD